MIHDSLVKRAFLARGVGARGTVDVADDILGGVAVLSRRRGDAPPARSKRAGSLQGPALRREPCALGRAQAPSDAARRAVAVSDIK